MVYFLSDKCHDMDMTNDNIGSMTHTLYIANPTGNLP